MSAHSYFSLKQIRRNLSRPSQDLEHVTQVVLVLRRNNNLTRTMSESGSNRRQKSIFTASNRQSAVPVWVLFTLVVIEMITEVPTIWKYLIRGWNPSLHRENKSFLPVIKGKYWSLCNTNNMYTHFFISEYVCVGFSVIFAQYESHKASVLSFSVLIWKVPVSPTVTLSVICVATRYRDNYNTPVWSPVNTSAFHKPGSKRDWSILMNQNGRRIEAADSHTRFKQSTVLLLKTYIVEWLS